MTRPDAESRPDVATTGGDDPRLNVLGVGVSALDMRTAMARLRGWVERGERHYVCVSGVHGVMESQSDEDLRRIHNAAGMVTADGMPLVVLLKLAGFRRAERVYGPDLLLEACRVSAVEGWRHFFYGGGPGVAERLTQRLRDRYPGLTIVGHLSPPFRPLTPEEDHEVVETINSVRPDIVWVGLSTPKQERWMAGHVDRIDAAALIGIGAAFDFHAGVKRQAPRWMQRSGLEWLFRLATEPRRLWRRYLSNNPRFVALVLAQRLGLRKFPL
jgi:N-acetylglucosaminyldiphosphoundecaprenol N-acetyl-beta-D-mannosaminyltransferase